MSVEIRELVIRAVVDDSRERREAGPGQEGQKAADADAAAIVEECVRQVLKILKKSGEK
jgi:hypothetical protein